MGIYQPSRMQCQLLAGLGCRVTLLITTLLLVKATNAQTISRSLAISNGQKAALLAQVAPPEAVPAPPIVESPVPADSEPQVLVSEVAVSGAEDQLQNEVYQVIRTRPGRTTTRSQLQEDIAAILATGYFADVRAVPEDTPMGVRVIFVVRPNPVLQSVRVEGNVIQSLRLSDRNLFESLPYQQVIDEIFREQYGSTLNLNRLKAGLDRLNQIYQENGYVVAQVMGTPQVNPDGTVTLEVAEGVIEKLQVRFLNETGEAQDASGNPIQGRTPEATIIGEFQLKPGDIFSRAAIEGDLQRVLGLGLFEDVKLALQPGDDPRKVVVVAEVKEVEPTVVGFHRLARRLAAAAEKDQSESKAQAKGAIAAYQNALKLAQADRLVAEEAKTLDELAIFYRSQKQYPQALETFERALTIGKTVNAPLWQAYILMQIATTHNSAGEKEQAIELYNQVLSRLQAIKALPVAIGSVEQQFVVETGQFSLALNFSSEGTALNFGLNGFRANHGTEFISAMTLVLLINQSEAYRSLGEYQQALHTLNQLQQLLSSFPQALSAQTTNHPSPTQTTSEKNTELPLELFSFVPPLISGLVYSDLGQGERALESFSQAQQSFQQLTKLAKQGGAPEQLDKVLLPLFYSALKPALTKVGIKETQTSFATLLNQGISSIEDPQTKALHLLFISSFFQAAEQNEKAIDAYQQGLSALETNPNPALKFFRAAILNSMGETFVKMGKLPDARKAYSQALTLSQEIKDEGGQATALYNIGKLDLETQAYDAALAALNQALPLAKSKSPKQEADIRLAIAMAERGRGNFLASRSQVEQAISRIESSPDQSDTTSGEGTPTKASILQSYIDLATYFASKQNYYQFYVDLLMQQHKQQPDQGYAVQALEASERSRARSLLALLDQANNSPQPGSAPPKNSRDATLGQAPRLATIQQLLDEDTLLLEYMLGEKRSYLWAVDKNGVSVYELPDRATIEATARSFYDFLTIPSQRIRPNKTARAGIALSQMVLGPVAGRLRQKQVVIVADGFLQYIPFSALPVLKPVQAKPVVPSRQIKPGQPGTMRVDLNNPIAWEPWLMQSEVVSLPSASILNLTRRLWSDRRKPSKELAVLADPILTPSDDRLSLTPAQRGEYGQIDQYYPRLRGTAEEANQILQLVPVGERLERTGFAASRQTAISPDLSQYRILHFATHGLLDTSNPARSGIVFSILNPQGALQRSNLTTTDVFKLKLDADLVVLSGCRTGLGKEVQGEGLIGLTGGLMYAGARGVLVSLWSVDDEATSAFMTRFYRSLLEEKLSPSRALREAQLFMQKDPRWRQPYYWAAFVLQGDWR